jgi:hypothetical protein
MLLIAMKGESKENVTYSTVCDSTVLKSKRIAPMGSNGLFLTCEKMRRISLFHIGTYNIIYYAVVFLPLITYLSGYCVDGAAAKRSIMVPYPQ